MTEDEIKATEDTREPFGGLTFDALLARCHALVAEVRRLRGLVAKVEWAGALPDEFFRGCPWCGVELEQHPSNAKQHRAECPAFHPDGAVR